MALAPLADEALRVARTRMARAGAVDEATLARYADDLAAVLSAWQLTVERVFPGGAGLPALQVFRPDGSRGVLKLGDVAQQAAVLGAADGRGYARLLEFAPDHNAILVEKLGESLAASRLTAVEQAVVSARVLRECWAAVPLAVGTVIDGGKAHQLIGILDRLGPRYGEAHESAVAKARATAERLAADERADVTVHGDPHAENCLQRGESWAFVDPDGFRGERSYDLGVVMRDYSREFAAAERYRAGAGRALLERLCAALAAETGEAQPRIWDWAFVDRVTTALRWAERGFSEESAALFTVADALVTG